MWQCDKCKRVFGRNNQSHICIIQDVGQLFIGKPDSLVLAWDTLTAQIMKWQPNVYSASTKSIVYTSNKAWLIVRPMKSQLDVKFYCDSNIESTRIFKKTTYGSKIAYHIRIKNESFIDEEILTLLRVGFDYSMK